MSRILVVTHGDYEQNVPDPGLTKLGKLQMRSLRPFFPHGLKLSEVLLIRGEGIRHEEACKEFTDRIADVVSPFAGKKEVMSPKGEIIFPSGQRKPFGQLLDEYKKALRETSIWLKNIMSQPSLGDVLIVGSRILVIAATGIPREEAKSAALYLFERTSEGIKAKELKNNS